MTRKVEKSDAQWREQLEPLQYAVTRQAGTERAFTGVTWDEKREGGYVCVCCGAALFTHESKFDSGCGWPSFSAPATGAKIEEREDNSLWATRTEVLCDDCGAHLGHVFPDGPAPTGQRYCINSAAMNFVVSDE